MNKDFIWTIGIVAAAGATALYVIKKSPKPAAATASNPAASNTPASGLVTGASSLAGDFVNWLTSPSSNTGQTNSSITTATNTAQSQAVYSSALDTLASWF